MDEKTYRKKTYLTMLKHCLIAAVFLALPGLLGFLYHRLFWLGILAVIPILYAVIHGWKLLTWKLTIGTVTDVTLDHAEDDPCTGADVLYEDEEGREHKGYFTISHYGDYEEGCEPFLKEMLRKDTEGFKGRKIRVFYNRRHPEKMISYTDDSLDPGNDVKPMTEK